MELSTLVNFLNRLPSSVYLWTATLIFAASNGVTRKVTEIGAAHLVDGKNPISLCNVLFVGNLYALAAMLLIFGRQWNQQTLSRLTRRDWLSLGTIAILSGAIGPGLIFAALDNTNVTSVVLIGRLEPPLTLAFSVLILKVRVNAWTVAGSLTAFVGVLLIAFLASSGQMISMMGGLFYLGRGELQVAIAAFVLAIATVISKTQLQMVPLGIFNLVRVGLGTIVFFIFANLLYGAAHFTQVLSPFLWRWMLLYGAVIVVAGQLCWFVGLRGSTSSEITLASSFNPIAAIVMAYLILGEVPTVAQYQGGVVILIGILLSLIGSLRDAKLRGQPTQISVAEQMQMATGFRGI